MKIEKNGFYFLEDTSEDIHISDNIKVCLFDEKLTNRKFTIGGNVTFHYFSSFLLGGETQKYFEITGQNSDVMVRSFQYALENSFKAQVTGELKNSFSKLDMNIISVAGNGGNVDIEGVVTIAENVSGVEGYLKQQNVFLGERGKIRGIPTLIVHSNDVKASHGCNIEKISDEKLFYLRSRGLDKTKATQIMLESYLRSAFGYLEQVDGKFYDQIILKALQTIA